MSIYLVASESEEIVFEKKNRLKWAMENYTVISVNRLSNCQPLKDDNDSSSQLEIGNFLE